MYMKRLKYSFKNFIVNGLGSDLLRICKIVHYCNRNNIELYLNEDDNWKIVPGDPKNWRGFFKSLKITNEKMEEVSKEIIKKSNELPITFEELKDICELVFQPIELYDIISNIVIINRNIKFDKPYGVIHIRRGDKVKGKWKEGNKHELEEYYNKIKHLYLPNQVFVMTDSPEVAKEAEEKGFKFDKEEIRRDGFVLKHYNKPYTTIDLHDEALTFFKNMLIFKRATHLVGSNASFFYIMGQLLNGKKGISLSNNLLYKLNLKI